MTNRVYRIIMPSLFLLIIIGCKKPKALQYLDFQNLNFKSVGITESVISADVRFFNPNKFKMKLKEIDVAISVNDKYMGQSKFDSLMIIPRSDTFFIPVRMRVDMKTLIANSVISLLSNEVELKMEGRAKVGKGGVYFNFPFSYQGRQKLDIKLFK